MDEGAHDIQAQGLTPFQDLLSRKDIKWIKPKPQGMLYTLPLRTPVPDLACEFVVARRVDLRLQGNEEQPS